MNGLALLAGEACLQSGEGYVQETRALIAAERQLLRQGLLELGCEVPPGEANFLLLRLPAPWSAQELQQRLGAGGILVRSCAMYPGLEPGHMRVAVKGRADNARLLRELGALLRAGI